MPAKSLRRSVCAHKRISRATLALLAACGALAVTDAQAHAQGPPRDEDVVAEVNGTPILRKSVRELVQAVLIAQGDEPDPAAVEKLAETALNSLIDHELLYQESRKQGIVVTDADVDEELARNKARFPDAASFQQALRERGVSEQALREDTRKTMAVTRFLEDHMARNVRIPTAEIETFYGRNRQEFRHPAEIRASHVLIRVRQDADAKTRAAARARAASLLAELKTGADFASLAREHSEDPGTARLGGDLGYFSRGQMVPEFETPAFALQPGELSDIVTTPYGFHLIKATDRREAGVRPLNEVEDRIRAVLAKTERQRLQQELLADLRSKADIRLQEP